MACELAMQCELVYGFLKCALPEDRIDMYLKVHTLKGIQTFKKDYKSKTSKCSPWGSQVHLYPTLRKKMVEFMLRRQITFSPYANKTYHPKPKNKPKKEKSSTAYKTRQK